MLSLDPNAVNQKYPGNDLVEEYFCSGAIVTGSEDNKNVITRAINAMSVSRILHHSHPYFI